MSCTANIFDDILTGEDAGGVLTFLFYDADEDANPDPGGSPFFIGSNGDIDVNGYVPGRYYINYTVGEGDCEVSLDFFIEVIPRPDAGVSATIGVCTSDSIINIFSLIGGTPDVIGDWSGSIGSPGYDANDPDDPMDDTFDPSLSGEGLFTFIYTVGAIPPVGFTLFNCPNCNDVSVTVTISVADCSPPPPCDTGTSASVDVCASAGCTFNNYDELGGSPDQTGSWALLPGTLQQIIPTGGYLGTVNFTGAAIGTYQYEYSIAECQVTSIVTVHVIAAPWAGNNVAVTLCESNANTYLFPFITGNPNTGGTFTISPGLPVGSFTSNGFVNPAVGDAGVYTVTYTVENPVSNSPCAGVCSDSSIMTLTILAQCNAGTNTTHVLCQDDSIVLDATTLLGASTDTGTWLVLGQSVNCNNNYGQAIFSVNGGSQQNWTGLTIAGGSTLDNFASLGCIRIRFTCGSGGCTDTNDVIIQIVSCAPTCNAAVTISAIACALSSNITGTCPLPIYQWQQWNGTTWLAAPGDNNDPTYTGTHNGTYRLRVTNCSNCNPLFSNQITVSCPPSSCVIVCDSFVYNVAQQRLEAQWTMTGGTGNVQGWFNKATTNTPSCTNCGGWQVNQCNFTGTNATTAVCNVPQTGVEQCWRVVIQALGNPFCQIICCVKIPAIAALKCYQLPGLTQYTEIIGLNVDAGAGTVNIINQAQFGCDEYCSIEPNGTCDGNLNCSLAQIVLDINQWLTANGHSGTAYMIQSTKASSIKIKDTNVIFQNVLRNSGAPIAFIQSDSCTAGDTTTYHFQGVDSIQNFPVLIGTQDAGTNGSINLFDMLDLYVEDIPHTGTFLAATSNTGIGCASIIETCYAGGSPPVTVVNNVGFADHGDVNWTAWTPINCCPCQWQFSYTVAMGNGFSECFYLVVFFET